jgi:hypothetical protein
MDLIILPHEIEAFAHSLPNEWHSELRRRRGLRMHFPTTLEEAKLLVRATWGSHGEISWIAGLHIIDDHPLDEHSMDLRADWMPTFTKALTERLDSLGNDVYDTFLGAKHSLMHGRQLVDQPRNRHLGNLFKDKSAICIGAGPSASSWFDRIKSIQDEHVIICADSILGGLLNKGIEPDIVTMVERLPEMAKLVEEPAKRCKTHMWALPVVHQDAIDPFEDRVFWWWNMDDLYPWLMEDEPRFLSSGRSTGTMGLAVAAWLGCSSAYLVGHDLAYKDGKSHSTGTNDFTIEMQQLDDKVLSRNSGNYYTRLFDVPANGGGTVETCGMWELFKTDIEDIIRCAQGTTTFYNTNMVHKTGALIAGTQEGSLPEPTGEVIDKTLPMTEERDEEWVELKRKSLALLDDMDDIVSKCESIKSRITEESPLTLTDKTLADITTDTNLTNMVCDENQMWFQYVFRAAMRNLMVRLQQNTRVRTKRERNWNQLRVIDLYCGATIELIHRLKPELDESLEAMR